MSLPKGQNHEVDTHTLHRYTTHAQAHNTSCTPYTGTHIHIEHKRPGHTVLTGVTQGGHNSIPGSGSRSVKV
jgi:hypothetical protein